MGNDEKFKAMYKQTIDAIKEHLIIRPMMIDEQDILFTGSVDALKPDARLCDQRNMREGSSTNCKYVRSNEAIDSTFATHLGKA